MPAHNNEIPKQYADYHPPLHELILAEVLCDKRFASGLDIGCGTGRSGAALLQYCDKETGLDTSVKMLQMRQATQISTARL